VAWFVRTARSRFGLRRSRPTVRNTWTFGQDDPAVYVEQRAARGRPAAPSSSRDERGASGSSLTRPPPGLALTQVHEQQQRIERRSLILGCAVATVDPVPLREALAELLADITEAARTIGRLVEQASR
jgi:hypothetical protein